MASWYSAYVESHIGQSFSTRTASMPPLPKQQMAMAWHRIHHARGTERVPPRTIPVSPLRERVPRRGGQAQQDPRSTARPMRPLPKSTNSPDIPAGCRCRSLAVRTMPRIHGRPSIEATGRRDRVTANEHQPNASTDHDAAWPIVSRGMKKTRCPSCQSNRWEEIEVPPTAGSPSNGSAYQAFRCRNCHERFLVEQRGLTVIAKDDCVCPHCGSSRLECPEGSEHAMRQCRRCRGWMQIDSRIASLAEELGIDPTRASRRMR